MSLSNIRYRKAIQVSLRPWTTTKPNRFTARDGDGNKITTSEGPEEAAIALCNKMGWDGTLVAGGLKPGVWIYVWDNDDAKFTTF